MFECRGCGAVLPGRQGRVYCTNACQRAAERKLHIATWLETGLAFIDSKPSHYIRRYLAEAQEDRCALCGSEPTWNDKPLTFVLDHIDGDAANNRRDNLRMVCPNCDSQLPTYKNRNKGRGRASRRARYANGQSY